MAILAFDTCGPVLGVALLVGNTPGDDLMLRTERISRGAEAKLIPWALELLAEAGIGIADLKGVAAAVGPGAFTGIRVGLATAAGLAMARGVPFVGVGSLETRAVRVGGTVLSVLDARKSRVYAALYDDLVELRPAADVSLSEALSWVSGPFVATGEGAVVFADAIQAAGGSVAPEADHPAVEVLACIAAMRILAGEGIDPVLAAPVYLRAPDVMGGKG